MFESWKNSVLGKVLDTDGNKADTDQCTQVPLSWAITLYPGIKWTDMLAPVPAAKDWAGKSSKYFTWIANNKADVNQLPLQGDIMVFGATPANGSTDTFDNPNGHVGVCDSASPTGYTLVQQNAPKSGEAVNDTSYAWNYRPCLGWFRPVQQTVHTAPVPVPPAPVVSTNVGKTITFPEKDTFIPVYHVGGPYDGAHKLGGLDPALFHRPLGYPILADLGNGLYKVHSEDWGDVAVSPNGTGATIS